MIAFLVFILILSVLVLVHEFGHFIVAKRNGIRVEEFGLGLPPKVVSKKVGETEYSLNLLPFGGFVRLTGEDSVDQESVSDPKSFSSKSAVARASVLVAGVTMNLLLAVFIFYVVFFVRGFKTSYLPYFFDQEFAFGVPEFLGTVIVDISENRAASQSGVLIGEAIVSMNGEKVEDVEDVRRISKDRIGKPVTLVLADLSESPETQRSVTVYPMAGTNGNGSLGVFLTSAVRISYERPLDRLFSGFMHSYNVLSYSLGVFKEILVYSLSERDFTAVGQSVAGPVGIYRMVGGLLELSAGKAILGILDFVALMSLSLSFVNILPFPALDGGRLAFVAFEGVFKKKINPNTEALIHKTGMALLLGLLLLITLKDIFIK